MLHCVRVILLLILAPRLVESVFSEKLFGTLHETASLPCPVNFNYSTLVWSTFQKPDEVLVRCEGSSCSSVKGFDLPDEQYQKGNSSLTLLKADYELRGLYIAKCNSETICKVVFTLSPVQITRVINPGDPIDVHLPFNDLVEVSFNPTDSGPPSNLHVCTMEGDKIQCSPDYKERASRTYTLQIKDGNVSDTGNYTVRDTVNDEIIAVINVQMRDCATENRGSGAAPGSNNTPQFKSEEKPCDCKQGRVMPVWEIILIAVLLLVITVLIGVIVYLVKIKPQLKKNSRVDIHHNEVIEMSDIVQ